MRLFESVSQSSKWGFPLSFFTSLITKFLVLNEMYTPNTRSRVPGGSKCSFTITSASALDFLVDRAATLDTRALPADRTAFFVPLRAAAPPTDETETTFPRRSRFFWTLADFSGGTPASSVMASRAEAVRVVAGMRWTTLSYTSIAGNSGETYQHMMRMRWLRQYLQLKAMHLTQARPQPPRFRQPQQLSRLPVLPEQAHSIQRQ